MAVEFVLPSLEWGTRWALRIDTRAHGDVHDGEYEAGARIPLDQNTMMVLKRVLPGTRLVATVAGRAESSEAYGWMMQSTLSMKRLLV